MSINKLIQLNSILYKAQNDFDINKKEFIDKLEPFANAYTTLLRQCFIAMGKKYLTEKNKWEMTKASSQNFSREVQETLNKLRWINEYNYIDIAVFSNTVYVKFIEQGDNYREDSNDECIKQIEINESFFDIKYVESQADIICKEFESRLKYLFDRFNDSKKRTLDDMKLQKANLERLINDMESNQEIK